MTTTPLTYRQLNEIDAAITDYQTGHGPNFACCSAHAVADRAPALVAEIRRLQQQRKYLIDQLAKRDAASGAGDRALREFLDSAQQTTAEAERDSLGREADRLRKDWVEMRTRAERAEAERLVDHCPDHGCCEPESAVCHCEVADRLRRMADETQQGGAES